MADKRVEREAQKMVHVFVSDPGERPYVVAAIVRMVQRAERRALKRAAKAVCLGNCYGINHMVRCWVAQEKILSLARSGEKKK